MSENERIVRQATNDDLREVLRVDSAAPVGHERKELLKARVEGGECLVYECGGDVLGYLTWRPRSFFGRDFIELLAVDPHFRRRSVARDLVRSALDLASTSHVFTSTNRSNVAMRELLRKEDWRFSGELEGIDQGDPELVFYKLVPAKLEK
jgi:ribosomal protein S18 acetylase RimI-like enzyme